MALLAPAGTVPGTRYLLLLFLLGLLGTWKYTLARLAPLVSNFERFSSQTRTFVSPLFRSLVASNHLTFRTFLWYLSTLTEYRYGRDLLAIRFQPGAFGILYEVLEC